MPIMREEDVGDCYKWCLVNSQKWFSAERKFYPLYCSGLLVVISASIISELYELVIVVLYHSIYIYSYVLDKLYIIIYQYKS